MADFARIIQRSSIGYSSPSLCLGRSRIPPKFPFTTNSEIWFSRLNVMSRSLSLCEFPILRWNADFLCLRASLIECINSPSVGSAILDLVKLNPRLCAAKLKVGPIRAIVSKRVFSLQLHSSVVLLSLISAYPPILSSPGEAKDKLYHELAITIKGITE